MTASTCVTSCGDGVKAGTESCDDGSVNNGDGCSSACLVETGFTCTGSPSVCTPVCGDGKKVGTEICDDGDTNNAIGCKSDCSGFATGYTCSGGSSSSASTCTTVCGDGSKLGTE